MRWVRVGIVGILGVLAATGGVASYRAYYPISSVQTRVAELPIRAGTMIRVDTTSSGRGPASIRVELIQGAERATLVLDRVRSRRWAFWDFRPVPHATLLIVSGVALRRFTAGKAVVRTTVVGAPAWLRQPPAVVDEVPVDLDVAAGPTR